MLLLAAAALAADGARRPAARGPVHAALVADLLGAAALLAVLVAADVTTGTLGTVVLVVVVAGLALQAAFDTLMLGQDGG